MAIKLGIKRPVTQPLLPDPEARDVKYTFISVDDHLMEPPHTFLGRMPAKFEERAPKVVETEEGHEVWVIDDTPYFQVGFMCVAGRPKADHRVEPARFSEIRKGCWDIHARIKDMDLGGIWGSVNFPSGVTGFGGTLFSEAKDPELGLACVQRLERLALRGVVRLLSRPHRSPRHHLSLAIPGEGRRRDPPKRRNVASRR